VAESAIDSRICLFECPPYDRHPHDVSSHPDSSWNSSAGTLSYFRLRPPQRAHRCLPGGCTLIRWRTVGLPSSACSASLHF